MTVETIMVSGVHIRVIDIGQYDTNAKGYKITSDGRVFSNKIGGRYRQIGNRNAAGEPQFSVRRANSTVQTVIKVNSVLSALRDEFLTSSRAKPTVPGGRWFVALIEDGIPKFSETPVEHASESVAKIEASRLARNFPGTKFGVFRLVTACTCAVETWE